MKKKVIKRFLFTLLINALLFLSLFFFSPMEIYIGNPHDLHFDIGVIWLPLLSVAVGLSLITALLENLLIPKKVLRFINLFVATTGIALYIQPLLLNGAMGSLTGETDSYSIGLIIFNNIIWILIYAVVIAVYYLVKRKLRKPIFSAICFICGALIIMQSVGIITSVINTTKVSVSNGDVVLTNEDEFTVSKKGSNVVYFVIDTCDGEIVSSALEKYPDLFDGLDGFTYYPNATSTHSRTYPSVPYLLTGQKCYFDMPVEDYVADAYFNSTFFSDMKALIRLFTELDFISSDKVDNLTSRDTTSLASLNLSGFFKQSLKISLYKSLPYFAKQTFAYTAAEINNASQKDISGNAVVEDDLGFYYCLQNDGVDLSGEYKNSFRFYHFFGTHPGASINENAESSDGASSMSDVLKGNFKIIGEYLQQLKNLNVYDNTTVIITADHGYSGSSKNLEVTGAYTPIMLVKEANAENLPCKTSTAPVSHEDLFATVISALGGDYSKYGKRICDYAEDEQRTRYYYYSSLYSDEDGEVALREYEITGDARDIKNWRLTGNNWDIDYSHRAVSKKRLSDLK